jgi:hypothetical protein
MTDWKPISTVPFECDVELQVSDRFGEHALGFACRLTEKGWVNVELNVALSPAVTPLAWREWRGRGRETM